MNCRKESKRFLIVIKIEKIQRWRAKNPIVGPRFFIAVRICFEGDIILHIARNCTSGMGVWEKNVKKSSTRRFSQPTDSRKHLRIRFRPNLKGAHKKGVAESGALLQESFGNAGDALQESFKRASEKGFL